mmetsp:Transcript_863/g.2003  ORF Transcript_863/g.2003 Transcript_863/m.2003 type:complete len:261 (+) Transcript_863:173-955(+)
MTAMLACPTGITAGPTSRSPGVATTISWAALAWRTASGMLTLWCTPSWATMPATADMTAMQATPIGSTAGRTIRRRTAASTSTGAASHTTATTTRRNTTRGRRRSATIAAATSKSPAPPPRCRLSGVTPRARFTATPAPASSALTGRWSTPSTARRMPAIWPTVPCRWSATSAAPAAFRKRAVATRALAPIPTTAMPLWATGAVHGRPRRRSGAARASRRAARTRTRLRTAMLEPAWSGRKSLSRTTGRGRPYLPSAVRS